jgi:rhodanese-related sulfurtransferase
MFAKFRPHLALFAVSVLLLAACQSPYANLGRKANMNGVDYRIVSVQELQSMLGKKDFTLINVHIPWEGDIPQTDLRLAYDQIEQHLDQLPREKDAMILVYCLTSGMAKKAIATLLDQGYTNLWMLEGGTTAWEEAGLTLEKK